MNEKQDLLPMLPPGCFAPDGQRLGDGQYDPGLPLAFRSVDVFDLKIENLFILENARTQGA